MKNPIKINSINLTEGVTINKNVEITLDSKIQVSFNQKYNQVKVTLANGTSKLFDLAKNSIQIFNLDGTKTETEISNVAFDATVIKKIKLVSAR